MMKVIYLFFLILFILTIITSYWPESKNRKYLEINWGIGFKQRALAFSKRKKERERGVTIYKL